MDKEALFWDLIKDSKNAADFREYLKNYPKGSFAGLARNRLAALGKVQTRHTEEKVAVVPPPAPPKEPPLSSYELMTRAKAAHDRGDYAEAMRWFRKAADLGNANAMENIGMLYRTGQGVIRDDAEALRWWRKAADLGDANAMFQIGAAYRDGRGVNRDYIEAMRWFRPSAERGNMHAMTAIGFLYQHALGVNADYVEAIRWYRKAAALGDARARQRLQELGSLTAGASPGAGPPVGMPPPRPGGAFGH